MNARLLLVTTSFLTLTACSTASNLAGTNPASSSSSSSSSSSPAAQTSDVSITSTNAGDLVISPLTVTGKARGTWFFEASLPVELRDFEGNVIVTAPAQADGDWMTADYVGFSTTLTFTTTAKKGFLVVKKDNPSGLPENNAEVLIPIRFN